MFSLFYDLVLFLFIVCKLPRAIYEWIFLNKKKTALLERFGFKNYRFPTLKKDQKTILVHAVSVGEVKAAAVLIQKLKQEKPGIYVVLSTGTETGYKIANAIARADICIFAPFDFSFAVKKLIKTLRPSATVFIESDFWYHLALFSKKMGACILALSAKMSENSAGNYAKASIFSRKLFSLFDLIGVQSSSFKARFIKANAKEENIKILGNLKFHPLVKNVSLEIQTTLKEIASDKRIITAASTHNHEEEQIINVWQNLKKKGENILLLIAPRHPERFSQVESLLKEMKIEYGALSQLSKKQLPLNCDIVLIDAIGVLDSCYSISDLAIVGGSFVDEIGGHNILEPVQNNVPVFFGHYMFNQTLLVEKALEYNAGKKTGMADLEEAIFEYFNNRKVKISYKQGVENLNSASSKILDNAYLAIAQFLDTNLFLDNS